MTDAVAKKIVAFDGDLRAVVNAVARAEHGLAGAGEQMWQSRGQADTRGEVDAIRLNGRVYAFEERICGNRRVIEIQKIAAILRERRHVLVTQARAQAYARSDAPFVLRICSIAVLPEIGLRGSNIPLRLGWKPKQKIAEGVASGVRISRILRIHTVENVLASDVLALQIGHGEVRELKASLPGVASLGS